MKQPGAGKEVHRGKVTSSEPDNSTLLRLLTCDPRQNVLSNIGNIRVLRFFIE